MVTFIKTIDVTRPVRISKRNGLKFNMLLDWCIEGVSFLSATLPARKTPLFLATDLENTLPSRKTAFFLATDLENSVSSRKTAFFLDGDLKSIFPSTKSPIFMDRTTCPHPMCDLFPRVADGHKSICFRSGINLYNTTVSPSIQSSGTRLERSVHVTYSSMRIWKNSTMNT